MCDFREAAENVRREIQERGAVESQLREAIQKELYNQRYVRPGSNVRMKWGRSGQCVAGLYNSNQAPNEFPVSALNGMFYNTTRKFAYYEQGVLDDMFKLRDHAARYIGMRVREAIGDQINHLGGYPNIVVFDVRWAAGVCHANSKDYPDIRFPVTSIDGLFDDIHFELNIQRD